MAKIENPLTVVKGGGTPVVLVQKTFTQNGTYSAADETPPAQGYDEVTVNVPQTLFRSLVQGTITAVTEDDLSGVTIISDGAFFQKASLQTIQIPNTVTEIRYEAFFTSGLVEIVIPNSVTNIGHYAFFNCTHLISARIGSGIRGIGTSCFGSCTALKSITIGASTPPSLSNANAFNGTYPVYVPTPDLYRATTNWSGVVDGGGNSRIFPLVSTVADLANIDTTTYTKACVVGSDESYKQYTYDGSTWNEVI